MIKNQSNIYRFPMEDHLGKGVTGLAPTIKLSKDGGNFAASTNSVTEPDTTNAPGLYQLILTAEECNCNLLTLVVNVPTGEWGAIFNEFEMINPGGATAAEVWQYNGTGGRTVTNTIPSASDNAAAVWGAQDKEITGTVTIKTEQASTFATASALSAVASNVSAVKSKTDNLPASPAAVGSEMALTSAAVVAVQNGLATSANVSEAQTAIINRGNSAWVTATGFTTASDLNYLATYGDANWSTATGFTVPSDLSGLSTFNPASDTVILNSTENTVLVGIKTKVDTLQNTDLTGIATSKNVSDAQSAIISAIPSDYATALKIDGLQTHGDEHWGTDELQGITLSDEIIEEIARVVWEYYKRTLTSRVPEYITPNE